MPEIITFKPVNKSHPWEIQNMGFLDSWSLFGDSICFIWSRKGYWSVAFIHRVVVNTGLTVCWLYMASYKTTNDKKTEQGCCLYIWDNLHDTIYHYTCIIANKHIIIYLNVVTKPVRTLTFYFLSKYIS